MNTTRYTPSPETIAALEASDIATLLALSTARFGGYVMEDGAGDGDGDGDGGGTDDGDAGTDNDGDDDSQNDDDKNTDDPRVKRANQQAAAARVAKNAAEKALAEAQAAQQNQLDAIAKALGLKGDDEAPDADKLATQVTDLTGEVARLSAALTVHSLAAANGANPVALLDSRSFTDQLGKLDATADDYSTQVATAIKAAVEKNAAYAADQGSGSGGSELDARNRENNNKRPASLAAAIGGAYKG